MSSQKELFDKTCLAVLSRLEGLEEPVTVDFAAGEGAQPNELVLWERRNTPCKLPEDLKGFYALFNGFSVRWFVNVGEKCLAIGEMQVNRLEAMVKIPMDVAKFRHCEVNIRAPIDVKSCVAFALTSSPAEYGIVVLLYRLQSDLSSDLDSALSGSKAIPIGKDDPMENPEVWFVDTDSNWFFLTHTFTHFLRIMVVHLGIIGWYTLIMYLWHNSLHLSSLTTSLIQHQHHLSQANGIHSRGYSASHTTVDGFVLQGKTLR